MPVFTSLLINTGSRLHCYAPTIFNGGHIIASPLSVHPVLYVRRHVQYVLFHSKNGFRAISLEEVRLFISYNSPRWEHLCHISSLILFCLFTCTAVLLLLDYEPVHEFSNNVVCVTSKASDQPAHMRSLIRAFASRLSIL